MFMCPVFHFTWLSSLLFALTGAMLGALGGGGSLLALPIFLVVLKIPTDQAVPATAAVVGGAALSGAWDAWRDKRLDLGMLARFGVPAMLLAAVGSKLTGWMNGQILHWMFVAILLYSGVGLLRPRPGTVPNVARTPNVKRLWVSGAGTGLLMGLFGVGGGFVATPALVLQGGLTAAAAIPVTLGVIALSAASSLAVQISAGNLRWPLVLPALIATLIGMEFGSALSKRLPSRWLLRGLAILLLGVAASMVVPLVR